MPVSKLRALVNLISDTVTAIEQSCASKDVVLPDLDAPFSLHSEGPLMDAEIGGLASTVVAAAAQLAAMLKPAPMGAFLTAMQFHVPSALRVAVTTNVVEILREAGPQGLHIDYISARNGVDAGKLGRILRLLATEHIFREISPDVFTNNRISSAIDTDKDVKTLNEKPKDKYIGTSGVAAGICHITDVQFKSSAYLLESLTDPSFSKFDDSSHTAFNKAFNTNLPIFSWFEKPGNEDRLLRFQITFAAGTHLLPPKAILDGYHWGALPNNSVVVDVGGGLGTQTAIIAQAAPHVKCIVQDRDGVIPDAVKYFNSNAPDLLKSGQVVLQGHDFFTPQPIKNARVYFMRMVLHDCPDSACIQILKHVRSAAGPDTELIIIETLMEYSCKDTTIDDDIPGMGSRVAPEPLLPNYGHANLFPYLCDVQLISCLNSAERTPAQFRIMLEKSGWKLKTIHRALVGHHKLVATVASSDAL